MLKYFKIMKLNVKLSSWQFFLSMIAIFLLSLTFLTGLYYVLNIQNQKRERPFLYGPVTSAPKTLRIDLDQPEENLLSFMPSIIVSGKTGPKNTVLISTDTNDLVIESKADGSFSTVLNLDEGINKIVAVVFDATGDSRSAERTVYYSKEKI